MHGGGGSKLDDIFSVGGNNLAPAIAACLLQEKHSSFILVPQAEKGLDWGMPSTHFQFDKRKTIKDHSQALIDLINQVHNNYNTDKNRVYLMGQSVGGSGAIYLSVNYPNVFAASVPIFGWSNPVTADKLDHAMWIFTAEYDKMKAGKPRLNFEFFQEARSSGKDIQFTCFGNAGHPSSYLVYLRLQFWDWLFAQERKNERKIEN